MVGYDIESTLQQGCPTALCDRIIVRIPNNITKVLTVVCLAQQARAACLVIAMNIQEIVFVVLFLFHDETKEMLLSFVLRGTA